MITYLNYVKANIYDKKYQQIETISMIHYHNNYPLLLQRSVTDLDLDMYLKTVFKLISKVIVKKKCKVLTEHFQFFFYQVIHNLKVCFKTCLEIKFLINDKISYNSTNLDTDLRYSEVEQCL